MSLTLPRIYNVDLSLAYAGDSIEYENVRVPFPVYKIVCHSIGFFTAANSTGQPVAVRSSLVNNDVLTYSQNIDTDAAGSDHSNKITFTYPHPININGQYEFRSTRDGVDSNVTGTIYLHLEFHGAPFIVPAHN